jgi:hypothetical protein
MIEMKCREEHKGPDCCFDWAYPIDWILHVQKVLKDTGLYKPLGGHIVWRYGPEDGICGKPVALCAEAQAVLDAYAERRKG